MHRDLKPENIFVDPSTHVLKIVDFGLAKFIQRENNSGSAGVPTSAMDGGNKPPDQLRVVEGDAVNDRERQRQKMKGLLAKARRMGRNMEVVSVQTRLSSTLSCLRSGMVRALAINGCSGISTR